MDNFTALNIPYELYVTFVLMRNTLSCVLAGQRPRRGNCGACREHQSQFRCNRSVYKQESFDSRGVY